MSKKIQTARDTRRKIDAQRSRAQRTAHLDPNFHSGKRTLWQKMWAGDLEFVGKKIAGSCYTTRNNILKKGSSLKTFFTQAKMAYLYMLVEPEILLFSILNALSMVAATTLFAFGVVFGLKFASSSQTAMVAVTIGGFGWVLVCLWVSSQLTGLFTGAMGISVLRRMEGQRSTVFSCLGTAFRCRKSILELEWATFARTLALAFNRIPDKHESSATSAKNTRAFYGWRLGKFAMLPSILDGKNLVGAGHASVQFVRSNFKFVVLFRTGYTRVRLLAYFCLSAVMAYIFSGAETRQPDASWIGIIAVGAMFAIVPSILFSRVFLYPILVITSCMKVFGASRQVGLPPIKDQGLTQKYPTMKKSA